MIHISDTHMKHEQLDIPDGDILIHSGDWTQYPFSNHKDYDQFQRWKLKNGPFEKGSWRTTLEMYEPVYKGMENETRDFLSWFSGQAFKHKILVAGNHDGIVDYRNEEFRKMIPSDVTYLEDSGCEIEGLKIWGTPWVPEFNGWWFMKSRKEMRKVWAKVPDDTQLLVSHGPPLNSCDWVPPFKDEPGVHVGCNAMAKRIDELENLCLCLFGHIHPGRGVDMSRAMDGGPILVNGAIEPPGEGVQSPIVIPLKAF